jgi:hypothetical protein
VNDLCPDGVTRIAQPLRSQHRLKFQFMQRETFNVLGISDERSQSTSVHAQFSY